MAKRSEASSDAVDLLKADHRRVEGLFADFEAASGVGRKQEIVRAICTELTIHATIEEEVFYPACKDRIEGEDVLDEAYVEHDGAKVLIAELSDASPDEEFYDAKVKVLKELIEHHVGEEEEPSEGLFAQAIAADLDMKDLAVQLGARRAAFAAEIEANGLPAPITRTFSGHELEQGAPIVRAVQ